MKLMLAMMHLFKNDKNGNISDNYERRGSEQLALTKGS